MLLRGGPSFFLKTLRSHSRPHQAFPPNRAIELGNQVLCVQVDHLRGKLFVALSGERFDGHSFARDAASQGAAAVLVEREVGELGVPVLRVASSLRALGANLSEAGPVIAATWSAAD